MTDHAFFAVDEATRVVRGRLLPFDEQSRQSVTTEPIVFGSDAIDVPTDPDILTFNRDHDRFSPIGRAVSAEKRLDGIYAEFRIAKTVEGDKALEDIREGRIKALSAEVADLVREGGKAVFARLTGAALVPAGAFAGAALFSLAPGAAVDERPATNDERDDASQVSNADTSTEPADTPSEEPEEESEESTVTTSIVPDGVQTPEAPKENLGARALFSAIHKARTSGDHTALQPFVKSAQDVGLFDEGGHMFALSDVKFNGTGGLNINDQLTGPAYLGELWAGRRFDRTIVPLLTQAPLTSLNATGWVWNVKPALATWAGNKAAVPSNTPTVTPSTFAAQRFAGGHDLAREFYDFNVTDVIESYVRAMVDSYASLSDAYALTQITAGATAVTLGAVASGQSKAVNAIIDLATAVANNRATPSFAIVGTAVYRDLFTTLESGSYAFVEGEAGITAGRVAGIPVYLDGRAAAGQVIVGAKEAATVWELPGSPIRVQANDLVNGGVDNAFFGYIACGVTFPGGLAKATVTYA